MKSKKGNKRKTIYRKSVESFIISVPATKPFKCDIRFKNQNSIWLRSVNLSRKYVAKIETFQAGKTRETSLLRKNHPPKSSQQQRC